MKKIDQFYELNLFSRAGKLLEESFATREAFTKVKDSPKMSEFKEKILTLLYLMSDRDLQKFDLCIKDFKDFSMEFLMLQNELEKTGKYHFSSYKEAKLKVYDNPEIMSKRYLNGLLASQLFWVNHFKMFSFFIEEFCKNLKPYGKVMEVPVGTGLYISEFASLNNKWESSAFDISESSCEYAKKICSINEVKVDILKEDVYLIDSSKKYDRIICGELLEHLENPEDLLVKLKSLLSPGGKLFITTAIWAAALDHLYLFKSANDVRQLILPHFKIESELVLPVFANKDENSEKTPINYACVLS